MYRSESSAAAPLSESAMAESKARLERALEIYDQQGEAGLEAEMQRWLPDQVPRFLVETYNDGLCPMRVLFDNPAHPASGASPKRYTTRTTASQHSARQHPRAAGRQRPSGQVANLTPARWSAARG